MIQKLRKSKGFTLIEMLVVIAIIAVLVSIIVPTVSNSTKKAKAAADAANLRSMAATLAVDYLGDEQVTDTYTAPKSKSYPDATMEAWVVNGNIECYFVNSSKYYSVSSFSTAAEGDGNATPVSPAPTSPSTKIAEATSAGGEFKKP